MRQGVERLREPVESCDVARDIQTVVSIKGTGQPIPEQLLPDFYAEHITLAMNRDRRREVCVLDSSCVTAKAETCSCVESHIQGL
jgi:hypothetical protein